MKRFITFSFLMLLSSHSAMKPVHPGAATGGILAAGAAGAGTIYAYNRYADEIKNIATELKSHIGYYRLSYTMGTIGLISGLISARILVPKTPQYKLYKAKKTIDAISGRYIVKTIEKKLKAKVTEEDLLKIIEDIYATNNHPHVKCANTLSAQIDSLRSAISSIDLVTQEQKDNIVVVKECDKYRQQANYIISSLSKALKTIKNQPKYLAECKAYDDMIEAQNISAAITHVALQSFVNNVQNMR